jgi:hypothetical protein
MSPEEVIGNFVSFELMIKGSKKIIELDGPSTSEAQPVAFKATEEKEESTSSRQPIDASKLDNEEMALIIKSFRQILKQRKGKDYKPRSKKLCYKCGKPGHFIAKCPLSSDSDRGDDKKGKRREKKRYHKKRGGDAHVCREWDSKESSSDEDAANIAVTKGLLFPNVGHKCLMAKDGKRKKVKSRTSTKYETSSDEDNASDEEDNLRILFANLSIQQKEKLNEVGDIVMTRLRSMPGGRHSHDSPETNPRRVMQSRLARGQPRARDPTTTRPRPTLGKRSSHNSPEAKPQAADAVTIRLRPTSSTWSCFMILIIFAT